MVYNFEILLLHNKLKLTAKILALKDAYIIFTISLMAIRKNVIASEDL